MAEGHAVCGVAFFICGGELGSLAESSPQRLKPQRILLARARLKSCPSRTFSTLLSLVYRDLRGRGLADLLELECFAIPKRTFFPSRAQPSRW